MKETLAETGMTRQQAHRYQSLAEVPEEEFELALTTGPATTAGIIACQKVDKARKVQGLLWATRRANPSCLLYAVWGGPTQRPCAHRTTVRDAFRRAQGMTL